MPKLNLHPKEGIGVNSSEGDGVLLRKQVQSKSLASSAGEHRRKKEVVEGRG